MDRQTANRLLAFLGEVDMKGKEVPDFNRVVAALLADVEAHEKAQIPDPPDGDLAPKDPSQKPDKELKAVSK